MSYHRLASGFLLGVAVLGISQAQVSAEETTNQSGHLTAQQGQAVSVSSQLREDRTAIDSTISLTKALAQPSILKVTVKNDKGQVMNALNYNLDKGQTYFSCWFGLRGFSEGDYRIEVSFAEEGVVYKGESQIIAYYPSRKEPSSSTGSKPSESQSQNSTTENQVVEVEKTEVGKAVISQSSLSEETPVGEAGGNRVNLEEKEQDTAFVTAESIKQPKATSNKPVKEVKEEVMLSQMDSSTPKSFSWMTPLLAVLGMGLVLAIVAMLKKS